ncbi:MAG: competence protein ComEC family protein, partial [[Eubacterium] siraeum]|nr:competence protein ComEC family protein [[Eubacterium] siraeum]
MTIKGKRIFNYRPTVLFAIALILGVILGEAVYGRHTAITVCLCVIAFLFILLLAVFKKTRKFFYIPLALLAGLIGISASNAVYDAGAIDEYNGTFTATVASEIVVEEDSTKFYVSDVYVEGKLLKYDAFVYMYFEITPDFNAGDTVALTGDITFNEHKRFDTYYASGSAKNVGYFASVRSAVKLSEGKPSFPLNVQLAIKKVIYENNDPYTAGVCQALLLGDKRLISGDAYDDVAASGLAHVLAVSGLHITAIASALYFILKKLKVNPKISLVIVTVITLLYSMICSFTASSLRAVVMTAVMMSASAFSQKRDDLSSLALAAILILLFRPTAVMEVGFLLSFFSVLGIVLFYKPFKRVGMAAVERISPKRKIGTRLVEVCALSFATNLSTLPLVAYFFKRIPTLYVLSNFFVLPYVMFIYFALLILTLLSLITTVG